MFISKKDLIDLENKLREEFDCKIRELEAKLKDYFKTIKVPEVKPKKKTK